MTTWRELLKNCIEFNETNDNIDDLIFDWNERSLIGQLDVKFNNDFGTEEGIPFRAYSDNYVYFCHCYDGGESVMCIPRNPNSNFEISHIGY